MENIESRAKNGIDHAAQRGSEKVREYGDIAKTKANEFSDKILAVGDQLLNGSLDSTIEEAKKQLENGRDRAYEAAQAVRSTVSESVKKNPLLTTVAGLALAYGISTLVFRRRS